VRGARSEGREHLRARSRAASLRSADRVLGPRATNPRAAQGQEAGGARFARAVKGWHCGVRRSRASACGPCSSLALVARALGHRARQPRASRGRGHERAAPRRCAPPRGRRPTRLRWKKPGVGPRLKVRPTPDWAQAHAQHRLACGARGRFSFRRSREARTRTAGGVRCSAKLSGRARPWAAPRSRRAGHRVASEASGAGKEGPGPPKKRLGGSGRHAAHGGFEARASGRAGEGSAGARLEERRVHPALLRSRPPVGKRGRGLERGGRACPLRSACRI
jgi:hypothetical protein